MKKALFYFTIFAVGYFVGIHNALRADIGDLGDISWADQYLVPIEGAYVRNSIRAENNSWSVVYDATSDISIGAFDAVWYKKKFTSLDQIPAREGMTAFFGSPVRLVKYCDNDWRFTPCIAQADWVSGKTTTDCVHYEDDQWWAAQSGALVR